MVLIQKLPTNKKTVLFVLTACTAWMTGFCLARAGSDEGPGLPELPATLPEPDRRGVVRVPDTAQKMRALTLDRELQEGLTRYLRRHGSPIAAAVVVEVATGRILAMVQGRDPTSWGARVHSALYEGFPAASLFKIVPTIAAIELTRIEPSTRLGLTGGCSQVHPRGFWLREVRPLRPHSISLDRAFANSCNSFYAKIALKYLGVGVLNQYAHRLGWGEELPTDFQLEPSPISPPKAPMSTIHNIGRYAAGFGNVGLSPMHAAWINLVIARDGQSVPLKIFSDQDPTRAFQGGFESPHLIPAAGSLKLRKMMHTTVRSGTAASAFRQPGMGHIKRQAGGKTGTLSCQNPEGLATWFSGMMPWRSPEIVVSSLVVNGQRWIIKGSHLAAEAFRLWDKISRRRKMSLKKAPARKDFSES